MGDGQHFSRRQPISAGAIIVRHPPALAAGAGPSERRSVAGLIGSSTAINRAISTKPSSNGGGAAGAGGWGRSMKRFRVVMTLTWMPPRN
jgi:hypothetical protein